LDYDYAIDIVGKRLLDEIIMLMPWKGLCSDYIYAWNVVMTMRRNNIVNGRVYHHYNSRVNERKVNE
jgi:hypothetical protein